MSQSRFPTDAAVIYEMRRAGTYHPRDCGVWRHGWCECGGFLTDDDERAWCAKEAEQNRAEPITTPDDLGNGEDVR